FFSPLGMSRSTFRPLVAMTYPFSQGHQTASEQKPTVVRPFAANSVGWPSDALFSTADDLARFLIAFLNGGKFDGRPVISPSAIAKLTKASASGSPVVAESYGGVVSARYGSHHILGGGFGWGGMRVLIRIVPDARFAIIIASNGGSRHLTKTDEKAMQMFLGPPGKPEIIASESLPMEQAEMTGYVGTYENERVMTLFLKDGRLFIRDDTPPAMTMGSLTGGAELPVTKIGENRFSLSPVGASGPTRFTLITGHKGKIEYLHIGGRALKRR
ncbi:MAG: serine hydrolase, partial [Acidobacteria bacterium]|nr:serine hydrolase [Acidobacteriota bacterium]